MPEDIHRRLLLRSLRALTRRQFLAQSAMLIGGMALPRAGFPTGSGITSARPMTVPLAASMPTVSIEANGLRVPAYLARPDGLGPFPGIVVLHEWWGLNAEIVNVCQRLAAEGFVALAPNLFGERTATRPDEARQLVRSSSIRPTLDTIQSAIDHLLRQNGVRQNNAGILAFSFSDRLAVTLASQGKNIGAVVVLYGGATAPQNWPLTPGKASVFDLYSDYTALLDDHIMDFPAPARSNFWGRQGVAPLILYAFSENTLPAARSAEASESWQRALRWLNGNLSQVTSTF